jgi:hypothetical protein
MVSLLHVFVAPLHSGGSLYITVSKRAFFMRELILRFENRDDVVIYRCCYLVGKSSRRICSGKTIGFGEENIREESCFEGSSLSLQNKCV